MMSISKTTPSISAAPPHYLGSLNNITSSVSTESTKLVLQPQAVFQVSNIPLVTSSVSGCSVSTEQGNSSTVNKSIIHTTISPAATVVQRSIRPSAAIITISTPTRASVSQPMKAGYGKHQLPVRPLPITSLSHVAPKPTATTTSSNVADPGGGFAARTSVQSTNLSSAIAAKPKGTQHILMAPGLRTPNPSLKLHATYSPTYAYQVPNQTLTTSSNNHPTINVTTTRSPASVLVRPIINASPSPRTFVPLTVASTTAPAEMARPTSVKYQPTSTISISIPAKPGSQAENARLSLSSSQVGKPIYQVGLTSSTHVSTMPTKPQRPLVSLQPGSAANIKTNYSVPLLANTPLSTSSGFTPTTKFSPIAAITTSAVAVAKVSPAQPTPRIPPVSTSISANTSSRSSETSTTSTSVTSATVASTLVTTRSSVFQPVVQPPIVFWTQASHPPSLFQTPYVVDGDTPIRPPINLAVNNAAINELQIRSSHSVTTTQVTVPAFTQGQLLHSSNSISAGKDRPTPHLPNTSSSVPPTSTSHLPNSSPKPAILRRPPRADSNINKKLVFESQINRNPLKSEHRSHNNLESTSDRVTPKPAYDPAFPFIKPELSGQGGFGKPVVTSNGVSPANKMRVKEYSPSTFTHSAVALSKELNLPQLSRVAPNFSEVKVKTEPPFQHGHFKIETGPSHLSQPPFHPYPLNIKDSLQHVPPGRKISIMQPLGLVAGDPSLPPAVPNVAAYNALSRLTAHLPLPRDFKPDPGSLPPSGGLKRDHDKMSESGIILHNSQLKQDAISNYSPRKKPRKQTHVVAEDLPEQAVEDEVSTDDADEVGDEPTDINNEVTPSIPIPTSKVESIKVELKPPIIQSDSTEYVDEQGVRYVRTRERPPITLWSGHRLKTVCNHFNHHSEVRAKEKKVSLQDSVFDDKYLKGWKILQFASQFEQLMEMDNDVLHRVEQVKEGLIQHVASLIHNGKPNVGASSPGHVRPNSTPAAPYSTPGQPKGFTSFVMSLPSAKNSNVTLLSSTSCVDEEKVSKLREEVLKVDDFAQANIQRCKVVQEQLEEAKLAMMKVLKQRSLAGRVVKVGRETHKANKVSNGNGSRNAKKKKTS